MYAGGGHLRVHELVPRYSVACVPYPFPSSKPGSCEN